MGRFARWGSAGEEREARNAGTRMKGDALYRAANSCRFFVGAGREWGRVLAARWVTGVGFLEPRVRSH